MCERDQDTWHETLEYEDFAKGAASFLPEVDELLALPDDAGLSGAFALIMELSSELQRIDSKMNESVYDYYAESYDKLDNMMLRVIDRRFELDRDRRWINQALFDLLYRAHELLDLNVLGYFPSCIGRLREMRASIADKDSSS